MKWKQTTRDWRERFFGGFTPRHYRNGVCSWSRHYDLDRSNIVLNRSWRAAGSAASLVSTACFFLACGDLLSLVFFLLRVQLGHCGKMQTMLGKIATLRFFKCQSFRRRRRRRRRLAKVTAPSCFVTVSHTYATLFAFHFVTHAPDR
jgi:hypothetical protein